MTALKIAGYHICVKGLCVNTHHFFLIFLFSLLFSSSPQNNTTMQYVMLFLDRQFWCGWYRFHSIAIILTQQTPCPATLLPYLSTSLFVRAWVCSRIRDVLHSQRILAVRAATRYNRRAMDNCLHPSGRCGEPKRTEDRILPVRVRAI